MDEKTHFAFYLAGGLTAIAYIALLIVLHISRYCMRKCPTCITGRQPDRRRNLEGKTFWVTFKGLKNVFKKFPANSKIPQQSGRRIIVMTAQELMAQGLMVPNGENSNNPMTLQQTTQISGNNRVAANTQNFLTQEKNCQNNENSVLNNGVNPVNSNQPKQIKPTAPPCLWNKDFVEENGQKNCNKLFCESLSISVPKIHYESLSVHFIGPGCITRPQRHS